MSGDLFNETLSEQPTPQTNEEWVNLQINAADVFSPHAPIDNEALFAGRSAVIHQLTETIFQRGRHAILYGERGVGKTSLTKPILICWASNVRYPRLKGNQCYLMRMTFVKQSLNASNRQMKRLKTVICGRREAGVGGGAQRRSAATWAGLVTGGADRGIAPADGQAGL